MDRVRGIADVGDLDVAASLALGLEVVKELHGKVDIDITLLGFSRKALCDTHGCEEA